MSKPSRCFIRVAPLAALGLVLACSSSSSGDFTVGGGGSAGSGGTGAGGTGGVIETAIESDAALSQAEALGTTPAELLTTLLAAPDGVPSAGTRNLMAEVLGRSPDEVRQKLATAANRFFGIGTGEPNTLITDAGYRLYYELPQDRTQAFIWAPDSNDIRSEGQSYGMMIAVQLGLREHFDRLWKFADTYLQYPADQGPWSHYFKWQGTAMGGTGPWGVTYGATTVPAPDGDEYFAAALYLADRRWGSDGAVNYRAAADEIANAMLNNAAAGGRFPIIHGQQNMVVFVPFGNSNNFSDPSYHLPAFYELFAEEAAEPAATRWRTLAEVSRQFLVTSANASTGLHPDYANFDGTPNAGGDRHDEFRFDAWRVVMNMAVDYAWGSEDARMKTQVEKYHQFFSTQLGSNNVSNALFALDGSGAEGGGSTALTATLASGVLASDSAQNMTYLQNAWNVSQQQGLYRYYQECVYLLGLLAASGQYGYTWGAPQ